MLQFLSLFYLGLSENRCLHRIHFKQPVISGLGIFQVNEMTNVWFCTKIILMCSQKRFWTCRGLLWLCVTWLFFLIILLLSLPPPSFLCTLHLFFFTLSSYISFPFSCSNRTAFMRFRGPCAQEKVRRLLALYLANHTTLPWLRLTNGNVGFLIICFLFVGFFFIPFFSLFLWPLALTLSSSFYHGWQFCAKNSWFVLPKRNWITLSNLSERLMTS